MDTLIRQVADEHQLELGKTMQEAGKAPISAPKGKVDDMEARLNNLKQI